METNSSIIPPDYYIKKMWKSKDPFDFFGYLEGFIQQTWIQGSFSFQKEMNEMFDFSRKLMTV